jgi:hypothetical protein
MDAASIRQLEPELDNFLKRFSHGFCDETQHLCVAYVRGQLSELEPIPSVKRKRAVCMVNCLAERGR